MAYCDRCERYFPHPRALQQHEQNSDNHHACDDCGLDFTTWLGLKEHYVQSPRHHYCQYCERHFGSRMAVLQHMDDAHWYCRFHEKVFDSEKGLNAHYRQSPAHFYCQYCDEHFDDEDDLFVHGDEDHHACDSCRTFYENASNLKAHYQQEHYYCPSCNRIFSNENNLTYHLNSSVHQPRTVHCPGRGCNKAFISMAGLTLHCESGICPSGLNRTELNRMVVRMDRNNVITNPARLITGPQGLQPPNTVSSWATELAWNGTAFECFLCHSTFRALYSLNAHLQSPKHEDKIYRCPKSDCRSEYSTLSALCQHVESGSCGVMRFRQVQDMMNGLVKGMRSIAM